MGARCIGDRMPEPRRTGLFLFIDGRPTDFSVAQSFLESGAGMDAPDCMPGGACAFYPVGDQAREKKGITYQLAGWRE